MTQSRLDLEQVRSILAEYRIHNADITLRCDATADDIIDVVEGNRVYIPAIYLLNKIDQISIEVSLRKVLGSSINYWHRFLDFLIRLLMEVPSRIYIYPLFSLHRSWTLYTGYHMPFQSLPITSGISTTYWRKCGPTSASSECKTHIHSLATMHDLYDIVQLY